VEFPLTVTNTHCLIKCKTGVEIHLPDSVGQGNAAGRQKQNGPTSVSIAEAADDRRGHELKEREEGAEKTSEKDRNE